ncbi:MAG: hypothetical protein IPL20_03300 [Saprospiraceae bacterium]|nr:hypothetical protein [Saprospiraceae bacterium]
MIEEIQQTDQRLKWLDKQQTSSPLQIANELKTLHISVMKNEKFRTMTNGLSIPQKNVLASAIAGENSPMKTYLPKYLAELEMGQSSLDQAIDGCKNELAVSNFNYLNKVIKEAAIATGFKADTKVIRSSAKLVDIVFTDEKGRKFTAYSKLNEELNPSLALDLEGFDCCMEDCTLKMNEIIGYINEKGIAFEYKKLKHNQPEGILRKMINKMSMKEASASYLNESSSSNNHHSQKVK